MRKAPLPQPLKNVVHVPALLLAARHGLLTVGDLVLLFRLYGFGGESACKKLVHRLSTLALLKVEGGKSSDGREKLVSVTPEALRILGDFRQLLDQLDSKH
jgi:hypothetical protein